MRSKGHSDGQTGMNLFNKSDSVQPLQRVNSFPWIGNELNLMGCVHDGRQPEREQTEQVEGGEAERNRYRRRWRGGKTQSRVGKREEKRARKNRKQDRVTEINREVGSVEEE